MQPSLQPLYLVVHLPQGRTLVGALTLCVATLLAAKVDLARQVLQLVVQGRSASFGLGQRGVRTLQFGLRLAQFALKGQRAFGARLSTRDSYIMEALTARRKEERVGVLERKRACGLSVRGDIDVAKLGQDHFE